jgi:hypothetical protein
VIWASGKTLLNGSTMCHSERVINKIKTIKAGTGPISYRRLHPDIAELLSPDTGLYRCTQYWIEPCPLGRLHEYKASETITCSPDRAPSNHFRSRTRCRPRSRGPLQQHCWPRPDN